jgi:serine/threonine protein kinase
MPRLGTNLSDYFSLHNYALSKVSIYDLGIQLLKLLEQIHNAGYVYNDLKLDNILVGYKDQLPPPSKKSRQDKITSCF